MTHRDVIPCDVISCTHSVCHEEWWGEVCAPGLWPEPLWASPHPEIPFKNHIFGDQIMHLYYSHSFVPLKSLFRSILFIKWNSWFLPKTWSRFPAEILCDPQTQHPLPVPPAPSVLPQAFGGAAMNWLPLPGGPFAPLQRARDSPPIPRHLNFGSEVKKKMRWVLRTRYTTRYISYFDILSVKREHFRRVGNPKRGLRVDIKSWYF